jgi:hypothetical protein
MLRSKNKNREDAHRKERKVREGKSIKGRA